MGYYDRDQDFGLQANYLKHKLTSATLIAQNKALLEKICRTMSIKSTRHLKLAHFTFQILTIFQRVFTFILGRTSQHSSFLIWSMSMKISSSSCFVLIVPCWIREGHYSVNTCNISISHDHYNINTYNNVAPQRSLSNPNRNNFADSVEKESVAKGSKENVKPNRENKTMFPVFSLQTREKCRLSEVQSEGIREMLFCFCFLF